MDFSMIRKIDDLSFNGYTPKDWSKNVNGQPGDRTTVNKMLSKKMLHNYSIPIKILMALNPSAYLTRPW